MKNILEQLFQHQRLSRSQAKQTLLEIAEGKHDLAQVAALMTALRMRAISVDELLGFRSALLEKCIPVDLEERIAIDLCGTGGDGKDTFNISTLASIVVAGAGYGVLKHSNYGLSSHCGSSNVMEYLGYQFSDQASQVLDEFDRVGISFLHAPKFHPAMKLVASTRKGLGVPTFFNMLGPLVNPAQPKYQMVGVFSLQLARLYQYVFELGAHKNYCIVHSLDGYDEVSLTSDFKRIVKDGEALCSPYSLGLEKLKQAQLSGGKTVADAALIFRNVLEGKASEAQRAVVLANAALAIQCRTDQAPIEDCLAEATESLDAGKALQIFKQLIQNKNK